MLNTNLTINWQANTLDNALELIGVTVFLSLDWVCFKNFSYFNFYYFTESQRWEGLAFVLGLATFTPDKKGALLLFDRPHSAHKPFQSFI